MMPIPPPPDESDKQKLVLKLLARLRCPSCGHPYDPQQCTVMDRRPETWVMAVSCPRCQTAAYVVVVMKVVDETAAITELSAEEQEAATHWPPISADDVLDLHIVLQDYTGDLETLLSL
jgi:hypothetical protein